MTVASLPSIASYVENGMSKVFAVPFRFRAAGDLVVRRVANGASTTLVLNADYSVAGGSTDVGGSVTTVVAGAAGARLLIARRTSRAQTMKYTTGDRFPAASHEAVLDQLMQISQEQDDQLIDLQTRAPLTPVTASDAAGLFPVVQADGSWGFSPSGPGAAGPATATRLSLALLKAAAITDKISFYDGSLWTWTLGNYAGQADDTTIVKADSTSLSVGAWLRQKAAATNFDGRSVDAKLREIISASDARFAGGMKGDGATNNNAALAAIATFVATASAAGNRVSITWPPGRYVYSVMPNLAATCLEMHFEGEVWLINTGTGNTLTLDGGAAGDGVFGMRITGFPRLFGGPGSLHGIYARSIHRSRIEARIKGAGSGYSGFYGEWLVSNDVHLFCNFNEGGYPESTPGRGMTLTSRGGNPNFQSSYNNLYDPELSGLPIGLVLDGALGNKLIGGAIQGNTLGALATSFAWANKLIGVDFEVNGTDVQDGSLGNQYIACDFEKGPIFTATARDVTLIGGETENITVAAGAQRTLLSGATYNRFGAGTITDAGSKTRRRDLRNRGTGDVENMPRARTPLTVGASPYSYTNTTGNDEMIIVSGGVVSAITLTRFFEDPVGITSGQFVLGPGDTIKVTYSSVPSLVRWTR